MYLPKKKGVTVYFMGDLISGKKKRKYLIFNILTTVVCLVILNDDVKRISVPHYEYVGLKRIKAHFFDNERAQLYLPDGEDQTHLPRGWIHYVLNTVLAEEFSEWIKARLEERHAQRR